MTEDQHTPDGDAASRRAPGPSSDTDTGPGPVDAGPVDGGPAGVGPTGAGPTGPGTQPETGSAEGASSQRLARSRKHKVVGGVCSGLGRYFDMDPVIFRVPLAVLSVVGGLGLIFYGFAWLLIPAEGEGENEARRLLSGRVEGTSLSAILIALVGCGLFLASLGNRSTPFSLMLVGAVIGAAYWSQHRRRAIAAGAEGAPVDPATAHAVADAPPETQAPPVPSTPSWWRDPLTKDGSGPGTGYLWGPDDERPYTAEDRAAFRRRKRCARRQRESFGGLVFLCALIAGVIGAAVPWSSQPLVTSLVSGLGCALAVFGLGLVVSAFVGRVGGGTIFMVIVTAVLLAGAAVLPKDMSGDWDNRRWAPATAAEVRPEYELGTGRAVLDLGDVRLGEDETVRTRIRLGAGEVKARVPDNVTVKIDYEIGAGAFRVRGPRMVWEAHGGFGESSSRTLPPADGVEPKGTMVLRVEVGVGEMVLVRESPGSPESASSPETPGAREAPEVREAPEARETVGAGR